MRIVAQLWQPARNQELLKLAKPVIITLLIAAAMIGASFFTIEGAESGSKTQLAMGVCVAVLPFLLYLAPTKPFIFPFALFVVFVPVDNLLTINAGMAGAMGSSGHVATVTKFLGLASGLAFIFWLVRNRRFVRPPKAVLMWVALLIWMSLTVFWALNPDEAVRTLVTYAELIMLYFVVSIVPLTFLELRIFLTAVVLGALVVAAYSIYQFHVGGNHFHSEVGAQIASNLKKNEKEGLDPNAITASLLLPIAIMLMAVLQRGWSLAKFGFIGILLVLVGGVYVGASRGGIVALGALLGYLLLRSRYKLQVLGISLLGLGAILAAGISSGSPLARFGDVVKTGGAGRLSIWAVGWNSFKHHWLFGAGVGNFPIAYDRSYIHIYQLYNTAWHRVSHNTPLAVAVELGVVGLVLAVIAGYQQWRMLSFITKSDPLYDLRIALEGAMLALFVASIFLFALSSKYPWLTLELMAATRAFALCRTDLREARPRAPTHVETNGGSRPPRRLELPTHA